MKFSGFLFLLFFMSTLCFAEQHSKKNESSFLNERQSKIRENKGQNFDALRQSQMEKPEPRRTKKTKRTQESKEIYESL